MPFRVIGLDKKTALARVEEVLDQGGWALAAPSNRAEGRFVVAELDPKVAKGLIWFVGGAVARWWGREREDR